MPPTHDDQTAPPDWFSREQGPGGLEVRTISADVVATAEVRASGGDDPPGISGLGSPYGVTVTINGFFVDWDEEVAPGAWRRTISRDGADIRSMHNHDTNLLLGRTTAETLRLWDDDEGLWYEVDINPDDPQAMSVFAKVGRRDVTGSSVWFRVVKDQWEEPTDDNDLERPKRTILEAELFEVGPVTFPAFTSTTVEAASMRALDETLVGFGVTTESRRASLAAEMLSDPEAAARQIREFFRRRPEIRDAVCPTSAHRPAAAAPQPTEPSAQADGSPEGSPPPHPTDADVRRKEREVAALAGLA